MTPGARKIARWRDDPVFFAVDEFGFQPDPWQLEALRVFPSQDKDKMRIALKACAGPGKSAVLAICGLNFLACYSDLGQHPKGAAISMSEDNLKDNLWPEFSKWMQRSEYFKSCFTWTSERIYCNAFKEDWFISARAFSKKANPEEMGRVLSGMHSDFVLFLIDESGDIPVAVLKSAEQALSSCRWGKIMQAGNPTSDKGMLYACCTQMAHLWHVITITGDPDDPRRSSRISKEWAQTQINEYGREDPWVMAFILGKFPPGGINILISADDVDSAMSRAYDADAFKHAQKRLGIDVAREGLDKTVLFPRQGLQAWKPIWMRTQNGHDIAARAMKAWDNWRWEMCLIDNTGGWGGSAYDAMLSAQAQGVIPINFASTANDTRYFNKRSEMAFECAKWIKRGGSLPKNQELKRELTTSTYGFRKGKFALVEKEIIKKNNNGLSPDNFDALMLTFAVPEMPGNLESQLPADLYHAMRNRETQEQDWNPLEDREGDLNPLERG